MTDEARQSATEKPRHPVSYHWGTAPTYRTDLRAHELAARVRWFINMRWLAVLACCGGTLAAALKLVPARVEPAYFAVVTIFLAVDNLVYTHIAGRHGGRGTGRRGGQTLLGVQMIGDFIALSVLVYACGSIETPLLTLFMAHVILATLFFNRSASLLVTGAAIFFASLPLLLEWASILPVLSIFTGHFKKMVTDSYLVTGGFIVGISTTFFVCWYLVSEISGGLKQREEQLEDAFDMLVKMDREKTQATLRATHELKAPFAAIKSYIYTLRDGYCGELPEGARKVVGRIGDRCDQLTSKMTDIIHLSNLRTLVVTDRNFAPVELTELLAREVEEARLLGKPRSVSVTNHAEGEQPVHVMGSREYLHTLFSNLLQNAVFYSREGGEVEVSVHRKAKRISVHVLDHGIGIPEGNLTRIFDEHFRSNNAAAHHPNGTGLGLSMVKEIARLHGAAIQVDSELGRGTRFAVSFDAAGARKAKSEREGEKNGQDPHH